jgi:hypothetical protein
MRYFATYGPGTGVQSPAVNAPPRRTLYRPETMAGEVAAAERKTIPLAAVYPGRERERPAEWEPAPGLKYDRGQQVSALAGVGGVLGLVGVFAGKPDAIDLIVSGGAAVVELQDRLGLNGIRFTVPAGQYLPTLVSRERVTAFNVSDAAPATVTATGKWALPAPAVEGYRRGRADDDEVSELGLTEGSDIPEDRERTYSAPD